MRSQSSSLGTYTLCITLLPLPLWQQPISLASPAAGSWKELLALMAREREVLGDSAHG